jgi:NADH-quinone oxidoreductase subunit C
MPAAIAERLRGRFDDVLEARGEVLVLVEPDAVRDTLQALRDDPELDLDTLTFVSATHHPGAAPEYWIVYQLRSTALHHRVRVKAGASGESPHVPSVVDLFPTADWHERETFDFYGVVFDGHPELTRILMPDEWEGHPLRKTEELGGVTTRYHGGAFIPPVDRRTT